MLFHEEYMEKWNLYVAQANEKFYQGQQDEKANITFQYDGQRTWMTSS